MPLTKRPLFLLSSVCVGTFLLFCIGCSGGVTGNGDHIDEEPWTRFCNVDAECTDDGFRCDRDNNRCVCTSDEACREGFFCNAFTGACVSDVPGCINNLDCSVDQYCDVSSRTCRPKRQFCDPCFQDAECGRDEDRCLQDPTNQRTYCGQSCTEDSDCPDNAICRSVAGERSCWPEVATCEQFRGCIPNSGQPCEANDDCTEGEDQVCDVTQGACVARVPTCPYGMVCSRDTRRCEAACVTNEDCYTSDISCEPEDSPCRCVNNECRHLTLCTQNNECEPGKVCVIDVGQIEGECRPDCGGDHAQCPQGFLCRPRDQRYECVAACRDNSDCNVSQNCIENACRDSSPGGHQYCQMSEVCDLCEICRPDPDPNVEGTTCQFVPMTCTECVAPTNACTSSVPACCQILTSEGYQGIDCSVSRVCPSGHQCIQVGERHYCYPTSDSVCQSDSCSRNN